VQPDNIPVKRDSSRHIFDKEYNASEMHPIISRILGEDMFL
jgi:hypothetical protein